jgi:hypothetical protein
VKRISMIVVAASLALALTATIGSASASAAVLCKSASRPCPSSEILPAGSWLTFGQVGNTKTETLTLKTSGGYDYHCGYVLMGEQTTAENAAPLPAVGQRITSECARGSSAITMSISSSNDEIRSIFGTGLITTGPVSISIAEGGFKCTYSGSMTLSTHFDEEELEWVEDVSGQFNYSSGISQFLCGGATATLTSTHLVLATESYVESAT